MRSSVLPAVLVLVLVGLVALLPERRADVPGGGAYLVPGSAAAGGDVAEALLSLPRLDLVDPPGWARQRGAEDPMTRALDRIGWGGHRGVSSARDALVVGPPATVDEVLARLSDLGPRDPILASKLVQLLGSLDLTGRTAAAMELNRRALSESDLVARAALRMLAGFPGPEGLQGILDRRHDEVLEVRSQARASLGIRARDGDREALSYILDEVEQTPYQPDMAYLTVLGAVPTQERVVAALKRVVERAPHAERLVALSALLQHGDEVARAEVVRMMTSDDPVERQNGLRMAALSNQVVGEETWSELLRTRRRLEGLHVLSLVVRAMDEGHEAAPRAAQLLDEVAFDVDHPCRTEAVTVLYRRAHPWAVEQTREELRRTQGPMLAAAVGRVLSSSPGPDVAEQMVAVAEERLRAGELPEGDTVLLCRLVARFAPERVAERVVDSVGVPGSLLARGLIPLLDRLGPAGLEALSRGVDDDRGAALYVYAAAHGRDPASLPLLEGIVLDEERDAFVRLHALDAIVRVSMGRGQVGEEALRRIADTTPDATLRDRCYQLFWNYL